jgi:hypothetical protein
MFSIRPTAGSPPCAAGSNESPSPSILSRGHCTAGSFAGAAAAACKSSSVNVNSPVES